MRGILTLLLACALSLTSAPSAVAEHQPDAFQIDDGPCGSGGVAACVCGWGGDCLDCVEEGDFQCFDPQYPSGPETCSGPGGQVGTDPETPCDKSWVWLCYPVPIWWGWWCHGIG